MKEFEEQIFLSTLLCERVKGVMKKFRITSLEELSLQSYHTFDRQAGFGKKSMRNLIEFLALHGYKLAELPPDSYWSKPKNV